jgi:hypothetical protein
VLQKELGNLDGDKTLEAEVQVQSTSDRVKME